MAEKGGQERKVSKRDPVDQARIRHGPMLRKGCVAPEEVESGVADREFGARQTGIDPSAHAVSGGGFVNRGGAGLGGFGEASARVGRDG